MNMLLAVALLACIAKSSAVCARWLVTVLVLAMGIVLVGRADALARKMLATRIIGNNCMVETVRSRSDSRIAAAGLRSAIRMAEFRSLFPLITARAEAIIAHHRSFEIA
jgi:hypothetical protein